MSDRDLLERAFAELDQAPATWIRPPGVAAARRRAHQRRSRHLTVAACVVVLAIAVPLAVFATGTDHTPQPIGPSPGASPTRAPATTMPAITTTASPGSGELANATIDLDWSWTDHCQSGVTTFRSGAATSGDGSLTIRSVGRSDIDHDGRPEAVATIVCNVGEAGPLMVLALSSRNPDNYQVLGTALRTWPVVPGQVGVRTVTTTSDGRIEIEVEDPAACCDRPQATANTQWRTFAWTGSALEQVSGLSSFEPPAGAAATLQVSEVTVSRSDALGNRRITGRITIANDGPQAWTFSKVVVWFYGNADPPWDGCGAIVCFLGSRRVGESTEISFSVQTSAPYPAGRTLTVGEVFLFADGLTYGHALVTAAVP
jgi:hypothetical protein